MRHILAFVVAGLLLYLPSCQKVKRNDYQDSATVTANTAEVDSIKKANVILLAENARLRDSIKASKTRETKISADYEKIYSMLASRTTPAESINDTKVLLAEHSKLPLKRD